QLKAVYLLLDNELASEGSRMSQDEIAAECNVNRSTLYRWRTQNQDFIDYRRERSEEHTSELQSRFDLVCRLLLEKKNKTNTRKNHNKNLVNSCVLNQYQAGSFVGSMEVVRHDTTSKTTAVESSCGCFDSRTNVTC